MKTSTTTLPGISDTDAARLSVTDQLFHDWQALKMLKDDYALVSKLLVQYFTWFFLTFLGAQAFFLRGDVRFAHRSFVGTTGLIVLAVQLAVYFFVYRHFNWINRRMLAVIEKGDVIDQAVISPDKLLNRPFYVSILLAMTFVILLGMVIWSYIMFYALVD
jgi:hypothetical protein